MIIDNEQLAEVRDILGDKAHDLIEKYLSDTQSMLSEIDILRASGQDESIGEIVHAMKSSSFQVGAHQIMEQADAIEQFINENQNQLSAMHHQSRLDHMIGVLRNYYASYQDEIYSHL